MNYARLERARIDQIIANAMRSIGDDNPPCRAARSA